MGYDKTIFELIVKGDKDMNLETDLKINITAPLLPLVVFGLLGAIEELTQQYELETMESMDNAVIVLKTMFDKKICENTYKTKATTTDKEH